jgi:hypothetical protein
MEAPTGTAVITGTVEKKLEGQASGKEPPSAGIAGANALHKRGSRQRDVERSLQEGANSERNGSASTKDRCGDE